MKKVQCIYSLCIVSQKENFTIAKQPTAEDSDFHIYYIFALTWEENMIFCTLFAPPPTHLINILHKYELLYVNQISIKLVDELINL